MASASDHQKRCCTQGYQASQVARMTRKETHEALAAWLPGRTAEGIKQAINAHVIGHEDKMLIKLRWARCWRCGAMRALFACAQR